MWLLRIGIAVAVFFTALMAVGLFVIQIVFVCSGSTYHAYMFALSTHSSPHPDKKKAIGSTYVGDVSRFDVTIQPRSQLVLHPIHQLHLLNYNIIGILLVVLNSVRH